MDNEKLRRLIDQVQTGDNAAELLKQVRDIVYAGHGEEWWNASYRIDNFELTPTSVSLRVSHRSLQLTFSVTRELAASPCSKPQLVA